MATNTISQNKQGTIVSQLTYADTGTITIGYMPANAVLQDLKVFVATAWDSSTSDAMTIGHGAFGSTSADVDEFEAAIDLQSAGNASLTILQLGQEISTTDNVPITVSITNTGTGLSAGVATVIFTYVQQGTA